MRHRLRPTESLFLRISVVAFIVVMATTAVNVDNAIYAAGLSSADPSSYIATEFPDRKTSSYDSQRFISQLNAHLAQMGWWTYIQPYSTLIKSVQPGTSNTSFTQVSGENLLACVTPPSPSEPVDLLIVAPYDTLTMETGNPQDISYTARASGALLSLATALRPSELDTGRNIALAFVSGHYQYGAGAGSLIDELTVTRGVVVKTALVLGDIDALDGLPLTIAEETPVDLVRAVFSAARSAGPTTVVGPRIKSAWYKSAMRPQGGVFAVESMVDGGQFAGEAGVLSSKGIPALTLGMPRNNLALPLTAAATGKTRQVVETLSRFISRGEPAPVAATPKVSEFVVAQAFGNLYFVGLSASRVIGAAASLLAIALLTFHARRVKDLSSLALLAGVLIAMGFAHPLRSLWFSGDPQKYCYILRPFESVFLYVWSGLGLVTFGVFRLWRIRTRIAYLHSRIPAPAPEAAQEAATGPSGFESLPPRKSRVTAVQEPEGRHDGWAGPWALAAMAAALLGLSLLGSELAGAALVGTLGLSLAVLLDHPERFPKPATLIIRILGAATVLIPVLWAGSPLSRDAARIYSVSTTRLGAESVAFTLSLAAFVACIVSSFHLPPPASKGKLVLVTVAELAILATFLAVGMTLPRYNAATLPARALVREFLGNEGRLTIDVTRPLATLSLLPSGAQPEVQNMPATLINRSYVETFRFGAAKSASDWAEIVQSSVLVEKGEMQTKLSGQVSATFTERPAYYQVTFQDVALNRNSPVAFRLLNLQDVIGTHGSVPPEAGDPKVGYSITFIWWLPAERSLVREFQVALSPASSRVDVTARAIYMDRSYLGLEPSAADADFTLVTYISGQSAYR